MRPVVRAAFVPFTAKFEGVVPHMYLDVKGLVTCGIGNLIDPSVLAMGLPWLRADGAPATRREIAADWLAVKARRDMAIGGGVAFGKLTRLHLDTRGISELVGGKLAEVEAAIRERWPGYEEWPADAQLGVLSMSWAMGPGFEYPRFSQAAGAMDFERCASECTMREAGNPGVRPRNVANRLLFTNAAAVVAADASRARLHYPDDAARTLLREAITQPAMTPPEIATDARHGSSDSGAAANEEDHGDPTPPETS